MPHLVNLSGSLLVVRVPNKTYEVPSGASRTIDDADADPTTAIIGSHSQVYLFHTALQAKSFLQTAADENEVAALVDQDTLSDSITIEATSNELDGLNCTIASLEEALDQAKVSQREVQLKLHTLCGTSPHKWKFWKR